MNSNQMPARLISPVASFLDTVGGEMGYASRLVIANRWMLEPLLLKNLGANQNANTLIRTTTAVTMMKGSDAPNVISSSSELVVNSGCCRAIPWKRLRPMSGSSAKAMM